MWRQGCAVGVGVMLIELVAIVALAFGPTDIQFMETAEAEKLYAAIESKPEEKRTDEDRRLHAALTIALGTLPNERRIATCDDHIPRCHTLRGVRLALQNPQ